MEQGMTAGGWIFVIVAWGSIIGLTVYCFVRVLGEQKPED